MTQKLKYALLGYLVAALGAQVYKIFCKASVNDSGPDAAVAVYRYELITGDPTPSTFALLYGNG